MAARITLESALKDIIKELEAINNDTCEDYFASRNKLWRRARWVFDHAIDIRVEVANNEQKGYSAEDLGFNTIPMRTKAVTGERQTADYVFFWKFKFEPEEDLENGIPNSYRKMGICFERKEVKDFHGTIISNYERFDREVDRFIRDPKTKMMYVLVEGSLLEALTYAPPNKHYDGDAIKIMISMKLGAISSIEARGVHISFRGSRKASSNCIKGYATHFFEKNVEFVLRDTIQEISEHGISDKFRQKLPESPIVVAPFGVEAVKVAKPAKPKRTYKKRRKIPAKKA